MSMDPEADVDEFVDFSQLKPADFESQLNTEFLVDLNHCGIAVDGTPVRRNGVYPAGASFKLKLVEVSRREALSPHSRQEPFVLLFLGRHDQPLHSDMHVLVHGSLGKLVLLLTAVHVSPGLPAQSHPEGRFYESVIN